MANSNIDAAVRLGADHIEDKERYLWRKSNYPWIAFRSLLQNGI